MTLSFVCMFRWLSGNFGGAGFGRHFRRFYLYGAGCAEGSSASEATERSLAEGAGWWEIYEEGALRDGISMLPDNVLMTKVGKIAGWELRGFGDLKRFLGSVDLCES